MHFFMTKYAKKCIKYINKNKKCIFLIINLYIFKILIDQKKFMKNLFKILKLTDGEDPDPRFTLANERTFLAWNRTALAILVGAVAFITLNNGMIEKVIADQIFIALILLSILLSISAIFRWFRIEYALRTKQSLPYPCMAPFLSIFSLILIIFIFIHMK